MESQPLVIAVAAVLGYFTQYWRANGMGEGKLMAAAVGAGAVSVPFVIQAPDMTRPVFELFQTIGGDLLLTWATVSLIYLGGVKVGSTASKTAGRFTPPVTRNIVRKPSDKR